MQYKQIALSHLCSFRNEKTEVNSLSRDRYVSTENMLSEKRGVEWTSSLPSVAVTSTYRQDDVLVSNIRPYFKKIWKATCSGGCSNDVLVFTPHEGVNPTFLYYVLSQDDFFAYATKTAKGTKMPRGDKKAIMDFIVPLIPLAQQRKIAAVLSSLDNKIETNNDICRNLEEQADALFKAWFVDFSFHASGKWRDSEMGAIPDGWSVHHMDDFFDIRTGKKDANVAGASGKYPFFSCAQDILWTDEYSFEGNAILVAGNGDFNVKRYVGKFEAYQRTYVLIPDKPLLSGILYYAIKAGLKDITSEARGSVIKFITKGSIAKFTIALPADVEKWSVTSALNNINTQIDILTEERRKLATLRDTLLPRLMSGEIDVDKVQL